MTCPRARRTCSSGETGCFLSRLTTDVVRSQEGDVSIDYEGGRAVAKSEFKKIRKLIKPYRVINGRKFRLKDVDPGDTGGLKSEVKGRAKEFPARSVELLRDEQARLYAQDRWAVLLIFQAMDAAGKDGAI